MRHEPTLTALRALRADLALIDNCYSCGLNTAGEAQTGNELGAMLEWLEDLAAVSAVFPQTAELHQSVNH